MVEKRGGKTIADAVSKGFASLKKTESRETQAEQDMASIAQKRFQFDKEKFKQFSSKATKVGGTISSGSIIAYLFFHLGTIIGSYILSFIPAFAGFGNTIYTLYMGGTLRLILSFLLLILAIVIVNKTRGWFLATMVIFWHLYLGAPLPPPTGFWIIFGVLGILYFGMKGKERLQQESLGFWPLVIFYLDIGILSLLVTKYNITITPIIKTLLLFMPWWLYYMIFNADEDSGSSIINFAKVIGIAYIFIILTTGVVTTTQGSEVFPSLQDITQAQKDVEEQYKEPAPLYKTKWQIECMFANVANPNLNQQCQYQKEAEYKCEQKFKVKTKKFEDCKKSQIASFSGSTIGGTQDTAIERYTKVELKKSIDFPTQVQKEAPQPIPLLIHIESPYKSISLTPSCYFSKGKENITGEIIPSSLPEFTDKTDETVFCKPSGDKKLEKGTYKVFFEIDIKGITTTSRLTRLFIGDEFKTASERSDLLNQQGLKSVEPSKSADEFASFSFGVGSPSTNPLLITRTIQPILGNVENRKNGFITEVTRIEIELFEGVQPGQECLQNFELNNNILKAKPEILNILKNIASNKKIPLLGCLLTIPSELQKFGYDVEKREFRSHIDYSYKIKKDFSFEVISYETPKTSVIS